MKKEARFEIVQVSNEFVLIRDVGPWDKYLTVTNDAEWVVERMMPMLGNGRRLDYIDSAGDRATILIKDGKFDGFEHRI